jgi:hypothetical protein
MNTVLTLSTNDIRLYSKLDVLTTPTSRYDELSGSISNFYSRNDYNVDLEKLLGSEYELGAMYSIEMSTFNTVAQSGGQENALPFNSNVYPDYRILNLFMTGLSFSKSTYDLKTNNNGIYALIGSVTKQGSLTGGTGSAYRSDEYLKETDTYWSARFTVNQPNVIIGLWFDSIVKSDDNAMLNTTEDLFLNPDLNRMQHFIVRFNIKKIV